MAIVGSQVVTPQSSLAQLAMSLGSRNNNVASDVMNGINTSLNVVKTGLDVGQTVYEDKVALEKQKSLDSHALLDAASVDPETGMPSQQYLEAKALMDPNTMAMISDSVRYAQTGEHAKKPGKDDVETNAGMVGMFGNNWQSNKTLADYALKAGKTLDAADMITLNKLSMAYNNPQVQRHLSNMVGATTTTTDAPAEAGQAPGTAAPTEAAPASMSQAAAEPVQALTTASGTQVPVGAAPAAVAAVAPQKAAVITDRKLGERQVYFINAVAQPLANNELKQLPQGAIDEAYARAPSVFSNATGLSQSAVGQVFAAAQAGKIDGKQLDIARIVLGDKTLDAAQAVTQIMALREGVTHTMLANSVVKGNNGAIQIDQTKMAATPLQTVVVDGKPQLQIYMPPKKDASAPVQQTGTVAGPATATTTGTAGQVMSPVQEYETRIGATNKAVFDASYKVASGQLLDDNDKAAINDTNRVLKTTTVEDNGRLMPNGQTWGEFSKNMKSTPAERVALLRKMNGFGVTLEELIADPSIHSSADWTAMLTKNQKVAADRSADMQKIVGTAIVARDSLAKLGYQADQVGQIFPIPGVLEAQQAKNYLEASKLAIDNKTLDVRNNELGTRMAEDTTRRAELQAKIDKKVVDPATATASASVITTGIGVGKDLYNAAFAQFGRAPTSKELAAFYAQPENTELYSVYTAALKAAKLNLTPQAKVVLTALQAADQAKAAGTVPPTGSAAPLKTIPTLQTGMKSKPAADSAALAAQKARFK